jgi:hypothetical protein
MLSLLFGAVIFLYRTFYLDVFVDFVCFEFICHRNIYLNFKFSASRNRYFVIADFTAMFHAQFECIFLICIFVHAKFHIPGHTGVLISP